MSKGNTSYLKASQYVNSAKPTKAQKPYILHMELLYEYQSVSFLLSYCPSDYCPLGFFLFGHLISYLENYSYVSVLSSQVIAFINISSVFKSIYSWSDHRVIEFLVFYLIDIFPLVWLGNLIFFSSPITNGPIKI